MKAYKNRYLMTGTMTTLLACLLLFSCNDDFLDNDSNGDIGKYSDHICFGISGTGSPLTRGTAGTDKQEYTAGRFVLRSTDSPDTLCVRTTVSDGIDCSSFSGETPVTRSAPVSSLDEYGSFHVQAHCKDNGTLVNTFYMNDDATYQNGNWSTENVHYWPGATRTLQFFAWAPVNAGLTAPEAPGSTTLTYTVPTTVNAQKDLVVATTEEIEGDKNEVVPLVFNHICTAVRFVTGSQMQPGTIKSVALKGVRYKGSYDMAAGKWAQDNDVANFTQSLDKEMSGNETDGTEVAAGEGTFMMLPQTLPTGAKVEVVFRSSATNTERILEAAIEGMEWPEGKTVTYKLSITPEYEMNIEVPTEAQDAHYITFPITVNVKDYDGAWTLTSNLTDDVFFTQTKTDLQEQGYWIDDDKGLATISGKGSGSFTYHVYVTENIADAARDIQFQITPDNVNGATSTTATVQQLCPSWNENIGCERIEDGVYPWGFLWDSNMKIKYTVPSVMDNFLGHYISSLLIELSNVRKYDYVTIDRLFLSINSVTIDFSQLTANGVAEDLNDGQKNTEEIYNYNGVNETSDLIARLERYGCTPDKELPTNPSDFAAKSCVLKNKFTKKTESDNGVLVDLPVLINLEWYLPAKAEASKIKDETYPLNDIYWTSTALQGSSKSYIYSNGSSKFTDKRDEIHNVRAIRKKP